MIYLIIAIVLILGVSLYIYKSNISKGDEVVEMRGFSCLAMEGYTFQYPVFKGLTKIYPDACSLRIKDDTELTTFVIEVSQKPVELAFARLNSNGIGYLIENDNIHFHINEPEMSKQVTVRVSALPIKTNGNLSSKLDKILDTIVETFKEYR
jgi:hypothetical protein